RQDGFDLLAVAVDLEVETPRRRAAGERAVVVRVQPSTVGDRLLPPLLVGGPHPHAWRTVVEAGGQVVEGRRHVVDQRRGGVVADEGVAEVADRVAGASACLDVLVGRHLTPGWGGRAPRAVCSRPAWRT